MTMHETLLWVVEKHKGQLYGDCMPFMVHPMLVARNFVENTHRTVALLHDIVEDTNTTVEEIRELFGNEVADAVDAISRRKGETYTNYIKRCAKNEIAMHVKIVDIGENLYDARVYCPDYLRLVPRYERALNYLRGVMLGQEIEI